GERERVEPLGVKERDPAPRYGHRRTRPRPDPADLAVWADDDPLHAAVLPRAADEPRGAVAEEEPDAPLAVLNDDARRPRRGRLLGLGRVSEDESERQGAGRQREAGQGAAGRGRKWLRSHDRCLRV